jgi:hypothetical protein
MRRGFPAGVEWVRTPRAIAFARAVLATALLVAPGGRPAAGAPKTDLVHLRNGDRVTGKIKGLDRARLTCSWDPS